jgi:hypothetical protein
MVIQAIYAVHPTTSRHSESLHLESLLDRWYIELPEHLRHEPGRAKLPPPLPHILTLHMQYWCTVLLLHRPLCVDSFDNNDLLLIFPSSIRHSSNAKSKR